MWQPGDGHMGVMDSNTLKQIDPTVQFCRKVQ